MDMIEKENLRYYFDSKSEILYVSIVDVIEMLDLSTDSRNYWKTLKNRLNKAQNQLVTKCNQLKMRASDGKMYLTDATDEDTMLLLIQHMAPDKVTKFRIIFKEIIQKLRSDNLDPLIPSDELSPHENNDAQLFLDSYQKEDSIFIYAMLAGMDPEDVSMVVTCKNILIKGEHKQIDSYEFDYTTQELRWGKFSRLFDFPDEVDIDAVETNFTHGMLRIKISILDKSRTRIIKLK